jgi:hypothetical protein
MVDAAIEAAAHQRSRAMRSKVAAKQPWLTAAHSIPPSNGFRPQQRC